MKKIVLIERLTIFTLVILIFSRIFIEKIYYRQLSKALEKNWVDKLLKSFGICSLGFNDIEIVYLLNSFEIRKKLEENFLKTKVDNNDLFQIFLKKYDVNLDKFKLCLRGELAETGHFNYESESISLIEKYQLLDNNKIYYFTNKISSYLLLKNYHKNLEASSLFFIFSNLFNLSLRTFSLFIKKIQNSLFIKKIQKKKKKNPIKNLNRKFVDLKNFKIAFFPHKGFRYGRAYSKTYFYNINENSKFNKKNILNIIREYPAGKVALFTKRFLSLYRLPNIYMKDYKEKNYFTRIFLFYKQITIKKIFNVYELILLKFISKTIIKIENNITFFDKLPNLKIILCDYDSLFEKTILIACDIKKIKTVAIQERYALNAMLSPLFFNYYFIPGEKFEPFFKEYGYIVDKYFSIGTSRSSLSINKKKLLMQSEYLRLKNINKKIILFVGLAIQGKFVNRGQGEDGKSIKNNIFFFEELINLSKKFINFHFIIRLKDYKNFNLLPKNIVNELNNRKNIEIDFLEKLNIYQLLYICDFVVGRATSIIEESLSDNIPAIVLDEMNYFSTISCYPLTKLIILAKSSHELNLYFDRFIDGKNLYSSDAKKEINQYFLDNENDFDFKSKLQSILEEII